MGKITKILCALAFAIAILAALPAVAMADTMDTRTLAMVNKPGVVLVYTDYTADMTWYEVGIDDGIWDDILADMTTMSNNGQLNTSNDVYSAYVQLYAKYMYEYAYTTGNTQTSQVDTGVMGTGFIVTPDGYMVTNAHVVQQSDDDLYYAFAVDNLLPVVQQQVDQFQADMRRNYSYEMTDDDLNVIYDAYFNLYADLFTISNVQTNYYCFMGNQPVGAAISVTDISIDQRKVGTPGSSEDVAIMKINGQNNLPTVTLGDDSNLQTGDQIYAMGYPAAATVYGVVQAPQAMQEPTLTQGIVSAKKQWSDGGSIIQMDAAINAGNSGGPLFDANGNVVGVNTFGLLDANGNAVAGIYYAIPIDTVKTYLNELNVTPSESKFTTDFKTALADYNAGKYNAALDLLHSLNDTNPGYPVVQQLLSDAATGAQNNPNNGSSGVPVVLIIVIVVAVVVIAGVIILILVMRKKKAKPAAGQPWQAGNQPMQPQYGQPQQPMQQPYAPPAQQYAPPAQQPQQQYAPPQQQQYAPPQQQEPYGQPQPEQYAPPAQQQPYVQPEPQYAPQQQPYMQPQPEQPFGQPQPYGQPQPEQPYGHQPQHETPQPGQQQYPPSV
ncbi:MAG: S1C family serine protease [Eggerthellaceae bacterium]|nr:S1C family serine protease [Eggerthellaceae bacterium]